jgi:hypothetical protein
LGKYVPPGPLVKGKTATPPVNAVTLPRYAVVVFNAPLAKEARPALLSDETGPRLPLVNGA